MIGRLVRPLKLACDRLRRLAESRRLIPTQATGRAGEDIAHRYLEERGFRIIARNWMPPGQNCEVDLVARDGDQVVFVEVKARRSDEYGDPERNVHLVKHQAMRRAAFWFMKVHDVPADLVRFDLVTVVFDDPPRIAHVPAFGSLRATRS